MKCGKRKKDFKKRRGRKIAVGTIIGLALIGMFVWYDDSSKDIVQNVADDTINLIGIETNVIDSSKDIVQNVADDTINLIGIETNVIDSSKVEYVDELSNKESTIVIANPIPEIDIDELKSYMLNLINKERENQGLNSVKLGTNAAAQNHAKDSLKNCVSGHWGSDGLKPYMRYSLEGGFQHNAENVSGNDYCIKSWENYIKTQPKKDVNNAMKGLMSSPGHRDNILDPHHKFVNIGLAWDDYNMTIVQHFEYHYSSFSKLPTIKDGTLSIFLDTINGATITDDSNIIISYDKLPQKLTRGQLASTYCYSNGETIAMIVQPLKPGYYYSDSTVTMTASLCPDPYDVSTQIPGPQSYEEAHEAHRIAKINSQNNQVSYSVPFFEADRWSSSPNHLIVNSDISSLILKYGTGVYTITVWGSVAGEDVSIAEHSIFYK